MGVETVESILPLFVSIMYASQCRLHSLTRSLWVGMATETGRKAVPANGTVAKETRKLCVVQAEGRRGERGYEEEEQGAVDDDTAGTSLGGAPNRCCTGTVITSWSQFFFCEAMQLGPYWAELLIT